MRLERNESCENANHVDVVILGAGPAGAATAIQCARHGLRVFLIERAEFPRSAPGETLHPGLLPLLKELGVEDRVLSAGFLRHEGHHVHWNEPERFIAFGDDATGPWLGLQAWRPDFDAILLERSRELGAIICKPDHVTDLVMDNRHIIGVETATRAVSTSFIVDATGRRRWLAQKMGLKTEYHSARRIAWYGYAEGDCPARAKAPVLRADSTGWTWVARVRSNIYQWTRLNLNNHRPQEGWMPDELVGLRSCGRVCGADVTWRIALKPADANYFLVGDAACILDPASSHGVLKAIMSGMMASYLIARIKSGYVSNEFAARHYSDWIRRSFEHDRAHLSTLYSKLIFPS